MPLMKDTFSLSLASGVNEKIDDKVAGPNQVTVINDCVINKEGRLQKRFGQSVKSTSVQSSYSNPLPISAAPSKTKVFAHENQLCMINNGALYSQFQGQNKWLFKGYAAQVQVGLKSIAVGSSASGTIPTDIVSVSGVSVAVGDSMLYVYEDQTGAPIANTAVSGALRLVAFSSSVWLISASGSNLLATQVSLTDGSLGAPSTLRTDYNAGSVSVATTTGSAIGEAAFIVYGAAAGMKVVAMSTSGSVPALGTLATGVLTSSFAICLEPTINPNRFYLSWIEGGSPFSVKAASWTFSSSAYTSAYGATTVGSYTRTGGFDGLRNTTLAISPVNNSDLYVFYDMSYPTPLLDTFDNSCDSVVYYSVLNSSGTLTTTQTTYGQGYNITGLPLRDTVRNSLYLPVIFLSPLQTTLLLMDVLKGRSSAQTYAVAKCLYGSAALQSGISKLRQVPGTTKYRMTNNGYQIDFDLGPAYAASSQYFAKTTHITGGLLWAYDGQSVCEHNFLIGPEITKLWGGNQAASISVTVPGTAGLQQNYSISLAPAKAIYTASIPFNAPYITVNSPTTAYYICWTVDGSGGDPAPVGKTRIRVALLSTDSAEEVALKTYTALTATGSFQNTGTFQGGYDTTTGIFFFFFRNSAVGTATAPTAVNMTANGSLSAGTYQYCAVYKWTDKNGYVYRSFPSVPQTISVSSAGTSVFEIWAPAITNKNASDVTIEIYRTQVNSTELQLLLTPRMSTTSARYSYYDSTPDTAIASNAILYTNGGTMENYNIGACTAISSFKNRLIVTSVDDQTASFYSRTNVNGEPVNFSAFNSIRLDQDGTPVTAHVQMDDKLCMFKAASIYLTAGDGSNDLGQNETFGLPLRIPGDFGANNPNSLVLASMGVIFQTPTKGIQVLGRDMSVQYIGAQVDDYKTNTVSGAILVQNYEHIIFSLSDSTTSLIYNYRFNRWDFFTNQQADSACLWQGNYARAINSGKAYVENGLYYDVDGTNIPIQMYIETVWLKVKELQTFARIYSAMLLGEYLSPHTLSIQMGFDFDPTLANYETHTFDAATVIGGGGTQPDDQTYQIEVQPGRQKCNSVKLKITETPGTGTQASAYFNALDFYIGLKPGLNKVKSSKSI